MYLTLSNLYANSYIQESFDTLSEQYIEADTAFLKLFNTKVA